MDVIAIAAVSLDGFIARHSHEVIDWSRDLALFKSQTMGYPVIMGSNTADTLAVELKGRTRIVVHRNDDPEQILRPLSGDRCFVIGGGQTFSRFAPFLTHLYLTPHPLIFGTGIPLFPGVKSIPEMKLINVILVPGEENLFQYQFCTKNGDNHHTH